MAQKRERAFAFYVNEGWSLRRIAAELKLGTATLFRWSADGSWRIHRQRAWNMRREELIKQHIENEALRDRTLAGQLFALLQDALLARRAYYEGALPKRSIRSTTADIKRLALAFAAISESDLRRAIYEQNQLTSTRTAPDQDSSHQHQNREQPDRVA